MKRTTISVLFLGAALSLSACSDRTEDRASETIRDAGATASSAADDAARNAERAGDAAADSSSRAGDALGRAADATGDAARDAGTAVSDALSNAARAGDAAVQTLDVKSALTADSRVDASNINVDTDHVTKTIVLKGRVPTAAQKTLAGQIATSHANSYNVRNELTVGR
ncbi:MAG: BON domain-containing protein [Vicinamibacterales bacterium]